MAALRETPLGFDRVDVSMSAWPQFDRQTIVAFWQATMPAQEQKKKLFVDDEVLCDLFERLKASGERATPALVEKQLARLERAVAAASAIAAVESSGGTAHFFGISSELEY